MASPLGNLFGKMAEKRSQSDSDRNVSSSSALGVVFKRKEFLPAWQWQITRRDATTIAGDKLWPNQRPKGLKELLSPEQTRSVYKLTFPRSVFAV